jgi:hypothetical protein
LQFASTDENPVIGEPVVAIGYMNGQAGDPSVTDGSIAGA